MLESVSCQVHLRLGFGLGISFRVRLLFRVGVNAPYKLDADDIERNVHDAIKKA